MIRLWWSNPWTVAVIALLIGVIVLAQGGFSSANGTRAGVALIGLLLVGFLWPPLGILIGGVALFYLVFVHGPQLFAQLSQPLTKSPGG